MASDTEKLRIWLDALDEEQWPNREAKPTEVLEVLKRVYADLVPGTTLVIGKNRGKQDDPAWCQHCDGKGTIVVTMSFLTQTRGEFVCPNCDGTGWCNLPTGGQTDV